MSTNVFNFLTSCQNQDDSYVTIFHPVTSDTRVAVPSHIKRFSIKMFTFTKDEEVLKDEVKKKKKSIGFMHMGVLCVALHNKSFCLQIYVHCDAVICDMSNQADGVCRGQCVHPTGMSNSRHQRIKEVRMGK